MQLSKWGKAVVLALFLVVVCGAWLWKSGVLSSNRSGTLSNLTSTSTSKFTSLDSAVDRERLTIYLNHQPVQVEIVRSVASITQGLSGRSEIGSQGMLFILPAPQRASFWMKDMRFDLDLIWVRQGRIIEITPQVPKPLAGMTLSQLPTYTPHAAVDMVLEVPAGTAAEWGLQVGDELSASD